MNDTAAATAAAPAAAPVSADPRGNNLFLHLIFGADGDVRMAALSAAIVSPFAAVLIGAIVTR